MSVETFEKDELIYRKATQEDLPKIMAFVDIFLRRDWLVRRAYLMTNLEKYDIWLVFDKEKLIAWAIAGGKKRTLWNLLVHPKYRGFHIGQILVEKLKPEIIRSKSDQSTGDPTMFYEKIGYRLIASKKGRKRNINIMKRSEPKPERQRDDDNV